MRFFEALRGSPTFEEIIRVCKKHCHPDIVWQNRGFSALVGYDAVEHFLREQKRLFDIARVKVLECRLLASDGDNVFFERRNSIVNSKDEVVYDYDILGVFQFRDGLILRWSDYMHIAKMQGNRRKNSFESLLRLKRHLTG